MVDSEIQSNITSYLTTYFKAQFLTPNDTFDQSVFFLIKSPDYYSNITPKNYLNLMPDENNQSDFSRFAPFSQFYNFGKKPVNAVKKMTVRRYSSGAAVDSTVSSFNGYIMSRDNYVLSVYMLGDDQPSIPAEAGKLKFSYKCK